MACRAHIISGGCESWADMALSRLFGPMFHKMCFNDAMAPDGVFGPIASLLD